MINLIALLITNRQKETKDHTANNNKKTEIVLETCWSKANMDVIP